MFHFLLAVLSASTLVQAQTFRDWNVVRETDAVLQVPACRAFTQDASNLPMPVELSLSFPTGFDKPPTLILKAPGNSRIDRAVISLSAREQEELLVLESSSDPAQQDRLWYVPVNMGPVIATIIEDAELKITLVINGRGVNGRISLSGSTAALNEIKRCLGGVPEILPTKFFRELNTAAGTAVLGPNPTVPQLMAYVEQAFTHFQEISRTERDLAQLRQTMRPLVAQETEAQNKLTTAQANLDRATVTMNDTANKIRRGEARLLAIPGEIASLQAQRPAAEQLVVQTKAALTPLLVERDRLQRLVDQAASEVSRIERSITAREATIRDRQSAIDNLRRELERLDRELDRIDQSIGDLERRKSVLETDIAVYSIERETQRILQNNSRYQALKNEKAGLPQQIQSERRELSLAQDRLRRAEDDLRRCRNNVQRPNCDRQRNEVAQAESRLQRAREFLIRCENSGRDCGEKERAFVRAQEEAQRAAGDLERCRRENPPDACVNEVRALEQARNLESQAEREWIDCRSSPPNCDSERHAVHQAEVDLNRARSELQQCMDTVIVPRCEREESEVRSANSAVSQHQAELNRLEGRLSSIDSELNRFEREARDQATRRRDEMAEELRRLSRELTDQRLAKERTQDRIRAITNSEIPLLQQEISRAQGELSILRRELPDAQRTLSQAQADLQRWKVTVDFDRIEREHLAAKRALEVIVNGIASLQAEQNDIQRNLPGWRTQLTQQTAEVNRLTPLRDTAKNKLDGIQQQLQPLRAQEKTMTDLIAVLKPAYDELRKLYQTLASQLLTP